MSVLVCFVLKFCSECLCRTEAAAIPEAVLCTMQEVCTRSNEWSWVVRIFIFLLMKSFAQYTQIFPHTYKSYSPRQEHAALCLSFGLNTVLGRFNMFLLLGSSGTWHLHDFLLSFTFTVHHSWTDSTQIWSVSDSDKQSSAGQGDNLASRISARFHLFFYSPWLCPHALYFSQNFVQTNYTKKYFRLFFVPWKMNSVKQSHSSHLWSLKPND